MTTRRILKTVVGDTDELSRVGDRIAYVMMDRTACTIVRCSNSFHTLVYAASEYRQFPCAKASSDSTVRRIHTPYADRLYGTGQTAVLSVPLNSCYRFTNSVYFHRRIKSASLSVQHNQRKKNAAALARSTAKINDEISP